MRKERNENLTTEHLLLRPLELGDVELVWPDIADPEISKYMAWEAHTEKSQTIDFVKAEMSRRKAGKGLTWAIFKDGAFCGIASLIALVRWHRTLIYNKAELAYWLSQKYQGRGIMMEAVQSILEYGFRQLGLHKITVSHFSMNTASEKLIKRLGFRYVGEQIEEFEKHGVWHNHKIYELLDRQFLNGPLLPCSTDACHDHDTSEH